MKTKQFSRNALGLVCLIICSKISIPIGAIPFTLQTLAVLLLGMLYTPKNICLIFMTYLVGGLCGLPFFASGGGISYILQPSFGFLLAFPIAAIFLSYTKDTITYFGAMLLSLGVIYVIGIAYMGMIFHYVLDISKTINELLFIGVLPFIWNDVISGLIVGMITNRKSIMHQMKHLQAK